jgi:3-isopropylmalate/(R)-2-methylmalate dehydratase small subunit
MKAFTTHQGLVASLDRVNVDTDQIIPKQFLKRIERTGYGQFLFHDWRFREDGSRHPDFELNQPHVQGASILLAGANFGCGSSREQAPWALMDYGFRCILASSFSDIFYNNCFQNGLLAVRLPEDQMTQLFDAAASQPGYRLAVSLQDCTVRDDFGRQYSFEMDPFLRECLLQGLDEIGLTLQHEEKIRDHERKTSWKNILST